MVTYQYSAWGELLSTTGSMANTIGATNPLRYRGYYFDSETGFYYLQSRYYDPVTCRFINEDTYLSTGQGLLGYNMFAYCNNNPVIYTDVSGLLATDAIDLDEEENDILDPDKGGGACSSTPPTVTIEAEGSNSIVSNTASLGNGGNHGSSQTIPQNAIDTLDYIRSHNGAPPHGYKGGGIYANDGRNGGEILPMNDAPYREYDIYPKIPYTSRGSERLVLGDSGVAWYTNNHYISFIRID